jgi:uncharacterized protein
MAKFRWNAWNIGHIAEHGVHRFEAEAVVESGDRRRIGEEKYKAVGRGAGGRWLQVIYIFDPPGIVFVIHARPLTESERHRARRRSE